MATTGEQLRQQVVKHETELQELEAWRKRAEVTLSGFAEECKEMFEKQKLIEEWRSTGIVVEMNRLRMEMEGYVAQQVQMWTTRVADSEARMEAKLLLVVQEVETKMSSGAGGSNGGGVGGLVDAKHMIPEVFDGKDESWKKWKESVEEYVKMKEKKVWMKMESVKNMEDEVDEHLEGNEGEMLMTLLKLKAKGESERIVKGVRVSRGLEAWRRLGRYYEQKTEDRAIQAAMDLITMASRRAKNPKEMKGMLVELDEKRRRVEEVNTVDEEQLKTVLTMMLDDETRRYTAKEQRGTYAELRRAVNEFLSVVNVVGVEMSKGTRQSDQMDIGRIERANDPWYVEVGQDGLNDLTWGGLGTGDWTKL